MKDKKEVNNEEWHRIGDTLTSFFGICNCQRKLKSIVDNLFFIYEKCNGNKDKVYEREFTGTEWLIIALLDKNSQAITHGTNCEYPIINKKNEFWKWIIEVKDNPNLEDN